MKKLLFLQALAPLHCGTGQSIGGIDLPIIREKATDLPFVPGSSIKGVLRAAGSVGDAIHEKVFGPETDRAAEFAGSVQFSDANLLFLPVRSIRGTFAWVTSSYILRRFARDARAVDRDLGINLPSPSTESEALVTGTRLQADGRVVFEDFDFQAKEDSTLLEVAKKIAAWSYGPGADCERDRAFFMDRVCVVHDDVMGLLLQTCTEVTARIKLDSDKKTVSKGGLWTEEALPVETMLSGLLVASPVGPKEKRPAEGALFAHIASLLGDGAVQFGGKANVGRGVCRVRMEG